ncbi:amino acid synthesis family protein [Microtetraspora fusca]|uniref:Amino acid synthesis family protein n=1 Tax=Microtetraspora fusca TaxID=1997 RepID=A0ABW6VBN1_MICFU|nr:amino acid synthesis family protein [Microtetraspora fusca]
MSIVIRKWVSTVEDVLVEAGRPLERPARRVVVGAVISNPYSGRYSEELTELIDAGETLGAELVRRCKELLGDEIEAYGKAGIVGVNGELEHASAVLHPKFGPPVRGGAEGVSILPSAKKRGGPGTKIDVPVHHKRAMLIRSHFDAVEFGVTDAPLPDELVIALAVTNAGRPHARVGGLREEDAIGEDGLR